MRMKKIIPMLLILCMLATALTGCGPNLANTSWMLVYADIYGMPFDDETMESIFGRLIYTFTDKENLIVRQDGKESYGTYTQSGNNIHVITDRNEFEAVFEGNVMIVSETRIVDDGEIQYTMKFQKSN